MKKILICCTTLLTLAFAACSDDGDTAPVDAARPVFSIVESDDEASDSAWISAEYNYSGTERISAVGFCYKVDDATSGYTEVPCAEGDWSETNAWCLLEELRPDTEYRYFCYLVVGGGYYNSISRTFTTAPEGSEPPAPQPVFGTPAARNLTPHTADLTCIYGYRGGADRIERAGYRYRKTSGGTYDDFELQDTGSPLTCMIERLDAGTDYAFYAYVTIEGETYRSAEATFVTLPEQSKVEPVFETPVAADITDVAADLRCPFAYAGEETIAGTGFCYKKTSDGSFTRIEAGNAASPITATPDGLTPATEYTFYAYAVLGGTTYRSDTATFTTLAEQRAVPVFGTPSSGSVTANSAAVSCTLSYDGSASDITEAGFRYKSASASAWSQVSVAASPGSKSATLGGLAPATNYDFHLYAIVGGRTYQSAGGSFTTQNRTEGDTGARFPGWAELPVETAKSGDYYYAYHLTDVNGPKGQKARNYGVCYSDEKKCAVWVAAPMHPFYSTKNTSRTDAYKADPDIPVSQPGKWTGYTRGHMLGSAERLVSNNANRQVFYYSNIAPQLQTYFNTGGGAWNTLEDWVDTQWQSSSDTTYQVIGSYWDPARTPKKVSGTTIPTHYYKVLLRTKGHRNKWVADCSRDELQCIAIMVEHRTYSKSEVPKPAQYRSKGMLYSVEEIEKMTGITFFPNVPNAPKDTYNASDWGF